MGDADEGFWNSEAVVIVFGARSAGSIGAIFRRRALVHGRGVGPENFGWSTTWQIESGFSLYACLWGGLFQMGEHHPNIDLLIIYLPPRLKLCW
jgi:hypothetical protein